MLWGFISGLVLYYFSFGATSGIILKSGMTNDYWNTGLVVFFTLILVHHMTVLSETRNFSRIEAINYSIAMLFMVVTI